MAGLEDYDIGAPLGQGAFAETFAAVHRPTGREVALKRLRVRDAPDWKAIELFLREGETLASLVHPGIARYVEAFAAEDGQRGEVFHLAQEKVDGENLAAGLARGERMDAAACADFLRELADTLAYLHGRRPPVIHRDLKPSNIMVRHRPRRGEPGHVLIDFGAIQRALPPSDGSAGSTIVGTSGYMPPEQLMGRTEPASDLYALGATAAHLLTGVHPSEMGARRLRLDWRAHLARGAALPDWLATVIDDLLAPAIEDRIPSAATLLRRIDTGSQRVAVPSGRRPGSVIARVAFAMAAATAGSIAVAALSETSTPTPPGKVSVPLDMVPEDAYPTTLPFRVLTTPALARHLGGGPNPFGDAFHVVPRAFTPGRFSTAALLLENRSESGWANVRAAFRLVDADGATVGLKDADLVAGYEGVLEPGDVIGRAVQWATESEAPVAAIEILVTSAERRAPAPASAEVHLEVDWAAPRQSGLELRFELLSVQDETRGLKTRRTHVVRLAMENVGDRPVRTLKLQKRLVDPSGDAAPVVKDHWAIPHGAPSLLPGERRVATLWSWEDAALSEWSISVRDVGVGSRR